MELRLTRRTPAQTHYRIRHAGGARGVRAAVSYAGWMHEGLLFGQTAAVLTASDRCFAGTQQDRSGPAVRALLEGEGARVSAAVVSPDDQAVLERHLRSLLAGGAALIVTTGGTGIAPRDNTPEATTAVCDRLIPGMAEFLRREGQRETPFAVLSRGVCGIAAGSLVVNLPGSLAGATSGLRALLPLLPHALHQIAGRSDHPA